MAQPSVFRPHQQDLLTDRRHQITPYNRRRMTDKLCLMAYGLLSLVVITAFMYAFIQEKDENLVRPEDPDARKCGTHEAADYRYIYFAAPFPGEQQRTVCVKKCPASSRDSIQCLPNSAVKSCVFDMTDHFNRSNQFIVYPTKANNYIYLCEPEPRIWMDAINSYINTNSFIKSFDYIYTSWDAILIMCPAISVLLVALYVFVITRITDLRNFFKATLLLFVLLLVAFSIYSFTTPAKRIFMYMPYLGIGALLYAVFFVVSIFCRYGYLTSSLDLVNHGAIYIRENRGLIFISLGLFILWLTALAIEATFVVFIYSIDSDNLAVKQYKFPYLLTIQNNLFVKFLVFVSLVHFAWTMLIINSIGEYLCMGSGTFWILNLKHNFKNSLYTMLRFHMGSVIYGSLVDPFFGKISDLLYFFMPDGDGRVGLLPCRFERLSNFYKSDFFKKYLGVHTNLNFIRVAMKGHNYLTAGEEITEVLVTNIKSVYKAYRLARIIVIVSKLLVCFLTTLICYAYIELSPNKNAYVVTNIILFLLSWVLTSLAFDSYDRSFQVILITVLFCSNTNGKVVTSNLIAHLAGSKEGSKESLYNEIVKWYNSEQKKQGQQGEN